MSTDSKSSVSLGVKINVQACGNIFLRSNNKEPKPTV